MTKEVLQPKRVTWLLLLYALPTRQNTERVNLWRKLKKFGAVALQTSGYVLPDDLEDEKFQRCECIGINAVLTGWARTSISDSELLEKGIWCFEGLYRAVRK